MSHCLRKIGNEDNVTLFKKQDSQSSNKETIQASNSVSAASALTYSAKDKPPYVVFIQPVNADNNFVTHPLEIGRVLSKYVYNEVLEIKKIGRNKVMAEIQSASSANKLVASQPLMNENFKISIPPFKVLRTGIIRDIPQNFELKDIRTFLESDVKILDIEKLNKRIKENGVSKFIPSRTLRIKFAGQTLPKHVFLFKIRHQVLPYIPATKICYNCFRIGHVSIACKSRPRCINCGGDRHEEKVQCPKAQDSPRCLNCGGDHLTTS